MKKHIGLAAIAFALLGAADPNAPVSQAEPLATKRHVAGVITDVEPQSTTIASTQSAVTGKIDPQRTKVTVRGRPGTLNDLKLAAQAKGELCLEDVWLAIDVR